MRRCVAVGLAAAISACSDSTPPKPEPVTTSSAAPASKVEWVKILPGTEGGRGLLKRELARARADGKQLLVYVGASWCEPCVKFHEAADRGELDATIPGVRFVDFDRDGHEALLVDTGCISGMIPLFSRIEEDGTCSRTRRVEGAVKGDGAVGFIMPKLLAILKE
jgi:thiol-disulfide isomerase/thioredoxin